MTLKLKNNAISNFDINTDMSILTDQSDAAENGLNFNRNFFNVSFKIKLSSFFVSKLKFNSGENDSGLSNGLIEGEELGYKIQCIFQNRDTFIKKFSNNIFNQTNDLNYYSSDTNENIDFLSQKSILNKYYKTNQDTSHTNNTLESGPGRNGSTETETTSLSNTTIVHNGFLNRFDDPQTYDPVTREYNYFVSLDDSKHLLNDKYNSVRIFILDKDNNIIGDSGTKQSNINVLTLASQLNNVNEMRYFKKEIVENLNLSLSKEDGNYVFKIVNNNIFNHVLQSFNVGITGQVAFENDYNGNKTFDFSFDLDSDGSIRNSTLDENISTIRSFESSIAKHYIINSPENYNNDCKLGIQAQIIFTRVNQDGTSIDLQNTYSFIYEKRDVVIPHLSSQILDSHGNSEFSKIFNKIELSPLIDQDIDSNFYLTFNGTQNIDQIQSSFLKSNVFLSNIRIGEQEISKLFQDAERLDLNAFTFQDEFLSSSSITLLNLKQGKTKFYFNTIDSQSLVIENTFLKIKFTFKFFLGNKVFKKTLNLNRRFTSDSEYRQRVLNINSILSNEIIFKFKNNLEVIKNFRLSNQNQESESDFLFTPVSISFPEFRIDTIFNENHQFFGYNQSEKSDFLSNLYVYLSNNEDMIIKLNFNQCFVLDSSTSTYKINNQSILKSLCFFKLGDPQSVNNEELLNMPGFENIPEFLRSTTSVEGFKHAIQFLNDKILYKFKINSLILPKKIDLIAGTGFQITEDDNIVLFPENVNEPNYQQDVLDANIFINAITNNNPPLDIFGLLFGDTSIDDSFYNFFLHLFQNELVVTNYGFVFKHNNNIGNFTLEEFVEKVYNDIEFIDTEDFETFNVSQASRQMLESDLIDIGLLDLDILPEKNIYRDFYNLEKTSTGILLVNNPFKVKFDTTSKSIRLAHNNQNTPTQEFFVDKMTIFNNVSEESIIKLDITSIKNSFGIIGNLNSSDIFIRAALFPLFTWHKDFINNARGDGLYTNVEEIIPFGYYYSKYRSEDGGRTFLDPDLPYPFYTEENYDLISHRPDERSLTMFQGKKYMSYKRFYARDKFLDKNIFKYSENYIPQLQINQKRSLDRDYIEINVNPNVGADILTDNDFLTSDNNLNDYNRDSNMFTPAVRFLDILQPMFKALILRLSVSLKVRSGSVPLYTTLYLNSIVQRDNHEDKKLFFKTSGSNQIDRKNQTFVDLKHFSNDD